MTQPLSSADFSIFHRKSTNIAISKIKEIDWILIKNFLFFYNFVSVWKAVLINMVTILMMSAKLSTPSFLKVFWNKDYEVIIFVFDVTNKILLRNSNYTVDLVMLLKFDNSNISMREVTITSMLWRFDHKKTILGLSSIISHWQLV